MRGGSRKDSSRRIVGLFISGLDTGIWGSRVSSYPPSPISWSIGCLRFIRVRWKQRSAFHVEDEGRAMRTKLCEFQLTLTPQGLRRTTNSHQKDNRNIIINNILESRKQTKEEEGRVEQQEEVAPGWMPCWARMWTMIWCGRRSTPFNVAA